MILRNDIKEAKDRMAAWWEGEFKERPAIGYSYQKPEVTKVNHLDAWYLSENPDNIKEYVQMFLANSQNMHYGAEYIPTLSMNYGPGIMAGVLGCTPNFSRNRGRATVWFDTPTPLEKIIDLLESAPINANNKWYSRILKVTETAAQLSDGQFSVAVTDLGGILDILVSFLSFKDIIVSMKRNPGLIDTCRAIIVDKWHKVYEGISAILDKYNLGTNGWLNAWCPEHYYPIQCDISASLSPKLFKQFVLPDLKEQTERLDKSIYHWDGPGQLKYADDLLSLPDLDGIQWVPGSNQPEGGDDEWMPVYKKVQKAGKFLHFSHFPNFAKCYRELDPQKVFALSNFGSEISSEFYLPEFMGGMGAIDDEDEDD
jgi:hypothetical protein